MGTRPEYENFWGIVHGGVLTVALDEPVGSAAWLAFLRRENEEPLVVAAEITVRFRAPAKVGAPLECSARVSELGHRHAIVEAKLDAQGTEIASMVGRYVKANERPGGRAARSLPPPTGDDR